MSQFIEVKTADLTGPALDWAVAMADGWKADRPQDGQVSKNGVYRLVGPRPMRSTVHPDWYYDPSTGWAVGGPLRDKYNVGIESGVSDDLPYAYVPGRDLDGSYGETALIAICRAIVAAKLGDVVQVPAELVGVE
ncbi:phage protein NinX family protein [Pseudomonas sp.]|uniref:phage protein NinX family protein n=1 Tax=Pseudomonas sp. TaxID=306 RepID=UPI002FC80DE3